MRMKNESESIKRPEMHSKGHNAGRVPPEATVDDGGPEVQSSCSDALPPFAYKPRDACLRPSATGDKLGARRRPKIASGNNDNEDLHVPIDMNHAAHHRPSIS
jgi:hypothetical protein